MATAVISGKGEGIVMAVGKDTLDLAFLNSFYHSGVRNPIDNAILACMTMPGHEMHE
ncbi:hypothetical protein K250101E9_31070 [Enterocloster aldenensis]|jgi:hypothetical protein